MFCWILNCSVFSFKFFYLSVFLPAFHLPPHPHPWEACSRKELPLCPMNLSLLQTQASSVGKKSEIVVVFHLISMVWKVEDYMYKKYICINVLILTLGKQSLGPPMSRKGHFPKGSFLPARPCLVHFPPPVGLSSSHEASVFGFLGAAVCLRMGACWPSVKACQRKWPSSVRKRRN